MSDTTNVPPAGTTVVTRMDHPGRLLVVLACIGLISLAGCRESRVSRKSPKSRPAGASAKNKPAKSPAVKTGEATEVVRSREYIDEVELPGASVVGFESTVLVAKQAGFVKTIGRQGDQEVDIGVDVTAGSVLAELHIPELEAELVEKQAESRRAVADVAQAEAAVEIARAMATQVRQTLVEKQALRALREVELQRIARLVKMGAAGLDTQDEARFRHKAAVAAVQGTEAEAVTAQATIRKAQADVARAKADAGVAAAVVKRLQTLNAYRFIMAPFDGVVVARHVDRGAFVRPAGGSGAGSPLFEVARIDRVRVVAHVPPSQIGSVRTGKAARFAKIGGLPGHVVNGTLTRSAQVLDQSSRKMRVEMHLDNPPTENGRQLSLGLFGTLTVERRRWDADNGLKVVSTKAVGTDQNGARFVVVVRGEKELRVPVEVVFDDADQVGFVGDVNSGDTVRTGNLAKY